MVYRVSDESVSQALSLLNPLGYDICGCNDVGPCLGTRHRMGGAIHIDSCLITTAPHLKEFFPRRLFQLYYCSFPIK